MKIGPHNTSDSVFIIAEIGNCHEGDFDLAKELVSLAAAAGADAVKFQTIVPERLVPAADELRIAQLRRFQFTPEQFRQLREEADVHGVQFMSTPFDLDVVDWLDELVPAWKIGSGDNDFLPLIERVAKTGKPVLISTGLGHHDEAVRLLPILMQYGCELGLLHCMVSYPTPLEEAGLGEITKLMHDGITPGYSDHTVGIQAAQWAVAAGARIVEKHFTIDKNHSDFGDHKLSADPQDLAEMVSGIRQIESALKKPIEPAEEQNRSKVRRGLVAAHDLRAGHVTDMTDFLFLRGVNGISVADTADFVGRPVVSACQAGETLTLQHFG